MSDEQILVKAIGLAKDKGWDWANSDWNVEAINLSNGDQFTSEGIIFNHDFAKALWGEGRSRVKATGTPPHAMYTLEDDELGWKDHLMRMVVSDDPIKYLGEHIDETL